MLIRCRPALRRCASALRVAQGRWEARCREHLFARHGMNEAQRLSVECLTGAEREAVLDELLVAGELVTPKDLVATIACISEERCPMWHMWARIWCVRPVSSRHSTQLT